MATAVQSPIFLQVGHARYAVASFAQASQMFCAARDKSGEGGSRTPSPLIVDENGAAVAHVSYNGRVWPGTPKDWQPGTAPLYDNAGA